MKSIFFKNSIYLMILSIIIFSCENSKPKTANKDVAYKFMNVQTYSASITEEMFWEFGDIELAMINLRFDVEALVNDVESLEEIETGMSEDFEYAFISKNGDTIYSSLIENLWTIKKNGKFSYYKDSEGELKKSLKDYTSFFSECW